MMKIKFLAVSLLATFSIYEAGSTELAATGSTKISTQDIQITVQVEKQLPLDECMNANSWRWGAEQSCPSRKISSIKLSYKGKTVFIPYSAFADLGNPITINLQQDKASYSVSIYGGDAATAYECILKFRAKTLLERKVKSREFPEKSWERTSYRFNNGIE